MSDFSLAINGHFRLPFVPIRFLNLIYHGEYRMNNLSPQTIGARPVAAQRGTSNGALSSQWFSRPADQRFTSLADLHQKVLSRAEAAREARVQTKSVQVCAPEPKTVSDTHKLWISSGSDVFTPTHWAFGQLCQLAGAPASYLRRKPSQLVADVLADDFLFRREISEVKLYHSDDTLYAATGPEYGRIYDHEVVAAVRQIAGDGIGETRWKVPGTLDWRTRVYDPNTTITTENTTLYASDRDVWVFLCDDRNPILVGTLPDGSPDYMFRGFYVSNSEVGSGSLRLAAFYLRAVCGNRIMWGVENFQEIVMRHTRYAPARFIEEIRPALNSFAEGASERLLDGVAKAKAAKVADDEEAALSFLRNRSFSTTRAKEILALVEKEESRPARTAWDMVQGITAFARDIEHTDARIEIESIATLVLEAV